VIGHVHFELSHIGWDALAAAATLALALFTWRLARRTADLATSTAAEVRAGLRPALVHSAGDRVPVVSPAEDATGELRLPLLNAGRGPALNAFAYAIVGTSEASIRTDIVPVGNLAPDHTADMVIPGVPDGDHGRDEDRTYYAAYATVIYEDLAGRSYYTVVALSDPAKGQIVIPSRHTVGGPWPRLLNPGGTETGEGNAPLPQWRVTFSGPELADDQRERLATAAVLPFGRHSGGTGLGPAPPKASWWRHSAFAAGASAADALSRVRDALADERFVGYEATIWVESRWRLGQDGRLRPRLQAIRRGLRRAIGRVPGIDRLIRRLLR
jgi:hypothetical protein